MSQDSNSVIYSKYADVLGENLANSCINISLLDSYVWFKNPKVASSTVDVTMQSIAMRNIPNKNVKVGPHATVEKSVHIKPYQIDPKRIDAMLVDDDMFKFTFVRNPYARLVSAYSDKIVGNRPNKTQILKHLDRDAKDLDAEVSFEDFVLSISNIVQKKDGESRLDRHWIPQVCTTGARWLTHDFVGKLENFKNDFQFVFDKLGLDIDDHYRYYAPHRNKKKVDFNDYLVDRETVALINKIYAEDFEKFGYEHASVGSGNATKQAA